MMDIEVSRGDTCGVRVRLNNHTYCLSFEEADRLLAALLAQGRATAVENDSEYDCVSSRSTRSAMRYQVNTVLKDHEGNPLKDREEDATLRKVLVFALLQDTREDAQNGEEKFRRFALAMKIQKAGAEVDLTAEEVALAKRQVGRICPTIVVGRVWEILEQRDPEGQSAPAVA